MNFAILLVTVLSSAVTCQATCTSSCLVDLPQGGIQGKCIDGRCSYTNVPYALPPTGVRRFEAPLPYNRTWSGIRDGTQKAIGCIQYSEGKSGASEDCLFVNIHTPGSGVTDSYPVRAYIHGGGFMFGESGDTDPSVIVKRDMIVVTIGYRLGPLGFLSTGDSCISGNNGLKDQREALRWIKQYISYFGGNPNRVLLSGFSAGGASSHLHILRKESLFNAVMANNGVAFNPWVFQTKPYVQFEKFVQLLKCPAVCTSVKECIQSKSVQQIATAVYEMMPYDGNPFNVFGVVVEKSNVADAFITEPPEDIIKAGKTLNVPFLIAYTEREGSYTAAEWTKKGSDGKPRITQLNTQSTWLKYAPLMLFYNNTLPAAFLNQRSIELKNQYLGDKSFNEESYREFEDMFTDLLYTNGIKKAICLHRKYTNGKLYVYEYKYPNKYGVGNLLANRSDISFGADHGADGIFTLPLTAVKLETSALTTHETRIANRLCELYKSLVNGRATYDGIELPLNTPITSGKLTINEYCHDMNYCNEDHCGDCAQFD